MRFFSAIRVFFAVLFHREQAERIASLLEAPKLPLESAKMESKNLKDEQVVPKSAQKEASGQSEAVTLLAALQREARLIDFFMENLDQYDDVQVGAAARSVHDQCLAVLERFFAIVPLRTESEQSVIEIQNPDATLVHFVGNLPENPPYRGHLVHHGWKVTKCELPKWSGIEHSVMVLAPAEIEVS